MSRAPVDEVAAGAADVARGASVRDIATRARVGIGTVSRVINQSPHVSPTTRARVLRVMRELDYRPLRRVSPPDTPRVAVIAPFRSEPATAERLRGVAVGLATRGADLLLVDVATPGQRDAQYGALVSGARAEAALVISLAPTAEEAAGLLGRQAPVVLLDCEHPELPRVVIDDVRAGWLATSHLLRLGHRRIAFVGDVTDERLRFVSSARRHQGYRDALGAAGLPAEPRYFRAGTHACDVAQLLTDELLELPEPPTAIVAASDTQALGVIESAVHSGVRIPEQLSVIGFDDLEVAAYTGLSTVRQPLFESGELAAHMLIDRILGLQGGSAERMLEVEVVQRRTTAPASK